MEHRSISSFKSPLHRLNPSGLGLVTTCRNISLPGNYWPSFVLPIVYTVLPRSRGPISCVQGTDNSAADAASAKGLSMTTAMAMVLTSFFSFMRRFHIFPQVSHIPGHLNDLADSLSRFKKPLPVEVQSSQPLDIPWQSLLSDHLIHHVQPERRWPSHFLAKSPMSDIGP